MKQHEQLKELYIARAEEAAKMYGLLLDIFEKQPWFIFRGFYNKAGFPTIEVYVEARGWKNASDAFVAAATAWSQKQKGDVD